MPDSIPAVRAQDWTVYVHFCPQRGHVYQYVYNGQTIAIVSSTTATDRAETK